MNSSILNRMPSSLLLAICVVAGLVLTTITIDLLYRFWQFLRVSVGASVLLGGDQIKLFINH